jgi:heme A synthase
MVIMDALRLLVHTLAILMTWTYREAKESNPNAWSLACLFICVFHRMIAGTTTRAMSVMIVETVAVCAMIRNVSADAQCPSPLIAIEGVPVKIWLVQFT